MKKVCIESPYAAQGFQNVRGNIEYAERCLEHALRVGVAPFASHLLYTRVLDDEIPEERRMGMAAGFVIGDMCDERWFYVDRGMSRGMKMAWERAMERGQPVRKVELYSSATDAL